MLTSIPPPPRVGGVLQHLPYASLLCAQQGDRASEQPTWGGPPRPEGWPRRRSPARDAAGAGERDSPQASTLPMGRGARARGGETQDDPRAPLLRQGRRSWE